MSSKAWQNQSTNADSKASVSNSQQATPPTNISTLLQNAQHAPQNLSPDDLIHLQRTIGNQAVMRLLQQHTGESDQAQSVQREVELRPPGRGEQSGFGRRQEIIDRLNAQSPAMLYRLDGQTIRYRILDPAALTPFDRRMQRFLDPGQVIPMRLITSGGTIGGQAVSFDDFETGYVDVDDMLSSDDTSFQLNMIHILTERSNVPNYARRLGTNIPGFNRAHRAGLDEEAAHLRDVIGDPTIRLNFEEEKPNGTFVIAFRSNEGYRIFHVLRRQGRASSRAGEALHEAGSVFVRTRDGRRLTIDQLRAERAARQPAGAP